MSLLSTLLAIASAIGFVALIMFVLFGQITVRKLRKNPELQHALGLELVSGWDIINVAQALAMPKAAMNKLSEGKGNLIRRVEKLKTLGAKTQKSLPEKILEKAKED